MKNNLKPLDSLGKWMLLLAVVASHKTLAQCEVEWVDVGKVKGSGWTVLLPVSENHMGVWQGSKSEEFLTVIDFKDNSKTLKIDLTKSEGEPKNEDALNFSTHVVPFKDDIYVTEVVNRPEDNLSEVILKPQIGLGSVKLVTQIENPAAKDVVYLNDDQSDNRKYTAIVTSSVLPRSKKDRMRRTPYLNLFFMYGKPREPEFYIRNHVLTVFDEQGEIAWTKSFTLGNKDSAEYINRVVALDNGNVLLLTERTPIRYFYLDLKEEEKLYTPILRKQSGVSYYSYLMTKNDEQPTPTNPSRNLTNGKWSRKRTSGEHDTLLPMEIGMRESERLSLSKETRGSCDTLTLRLPMAKRR
ncbi:MAG: hypothetical protein Kow0075_00200 [Salibacteraceae bacterium]